MGCKVKTLLALICALSAVWSPAFAIPPNGKCPERRGIKHFNIEKYAGHWYGYKTFNPSIYYHGTKCYQEKLELQGKRYRVKNAMWAPTRDPYDKTPYRPMILSGEAKPAGNPDEGKLLVTVSNIDVPKHTRIDYILDTDYDNYSVVVSCKTRGHKDAVFHTETYFIFSRTTELKNSTLEAVNNVLGAVDKSYSHFKTVLQDCKAFEI